MKLELLPDLAKDLMCRMRPSYYAKERGLAPYRWQADLMDSREKRKAVNGARQSGKSTTVCTLPTWTARYKPGSLSIVAAAVEKQALEDMVRIMAFATTDPGLTLTRQSDDMLKFSNGSRIVVVTATEKSARGWSSPDLILLDEASRIPDDVYISGIQPMLTENEKCTLYMISTPNGREGFFYRAMHSKRWERYEVLAPWQFRGDSMDLERTGVSEEDFRRLKAYRGVRGYYSPRHEKREEIEERLEEMGPRMFRQEILCEFVETEGALFRYADIDFMLQNQEEGLKEGMEESSELALVFDEEE